MKIHYIILISTFFFLVENSNARLNPGGRFQDLLFKKNMKQKKGPGVGQEVSGPTPPQVGTLDAEEEQEIIIMRQEEKLARDVYVTFLDSYPRLTVFANIARSEKKHMDAMLRAINAYGLSDPLDGIVNERGAFQNNTMAALYLDLVEEGQENNVAALNVSARIEELDIQDLEEALADTEEAFLTQIYSNLKRASYMHLRAFVRNLKAVGGVPGGKYQAQILDQAEVDAILGDNN